MAKRILMICTSHEDGLWAEELAAPYYAFKDQGCEVTVTSIKGGEIPVAEPSLNPPFLTKEVEKLILDDEAMKIIHESTSIADVNVDGFDAVFLPGGHGVCFDFADNQFLIDAVTKLYQSGKIVSAVCHGPCGLVNVKGADGKSIVEGKKVTGFTNTEEIAVGKEKYVPFLLEDRLKELGALFESTGDWQSHAVRDGNLITGQNPASSTAAAKLVIEALGA